MFLLQTAVSSPDIVSSLLLLVNSDSNEVQTYSAHCLARFAAWHGAAQQAICTPQNAEVWLHLQYISPDVLALMLV